MRVKPELPWTAQELRDARDVHHWLRKLRAVSSTSPGERPRGLPPARPQGLPKPFVLHVSPPHASYGATGRVGSAEFQSRFGPVPASKACACLWKWSVYTLLVESL